MRLSQIQFFLAVIDCGSIRAAARKLGISPPAITKSLRELEEELHVRLLERTQHGVVPTPAGRAFAARGRVVQSELRMAEEECAEFAGGPVGSVAFGAGPTTMFLVVPEALKQFRRQYPEARVRVVEGISPALLPLVRDRTLDFALGLRPVGKLESGLRFRPLFQDRLAIAARKGHPLRNEQSLGRLAAAQWIAWGPNWVVPALEQLFSAARVPVPRPLSQCDSFISLVALLGGTDMIAAMPARLLASPFARVSLQRIPIDERMPSNTQGILIRSDLPLTNVASAMARAVTSVARQLVRRD